MSKKQPDEPKPTTWIGTIGRDYSPTTGNRYDRRNINILSGNLVLSISILALGALVAWMLGVRINQNGIDFQYKTQPEQPKPALSPVAKP